MADYHNPTSEQRRRIKRLLEESNLEEIRQIDDLCLPCPYNKWGPLDPIDIAIRHRHNQLARYLVKKRELKSEFALTTALGMGNIEIAQLLHEYDFTFNTNFDYVDSIESMKLASSWGWIPSDTILYKLCDHNYNKDIGEMLDFILSLRPDIEITPKSISFAIHRIHTSTLIDRMNPKFYEEMIKLALKRHDLNALLILLKKGLTITFEQLIPLAISCEYNKLSSICEYLGFKYESLYSYIFSGDYEDDEAFSDNFYHYLTIIPNFKEYITEHSLMEKACEHFCIDMVETLVKMGFELTEDNVGILLDEETERCADRGYTWPKFRRALKLCTDSVREKCQWMFDDLGIDEDYKSEEE